MSASEVLDIPPVDPTDKHGRILDAALETFSAYGFSRTSMAEIAKAAEMSRPALYLHFANKQEIFRAALERILDRAYENGRSELAASKLAGQKRPEQERAIAAQLTEYLQRFHGDLMEVFRETMHGDDFLAAEHSQATDILEASARRSRNGLTRYFSELQKVGAFEPERSGQPAARWVELILLSPRGFKQDKPGVTLYRKRLETLAIAVAAGMSGATKHQRTSSKRLRRKSGSE